jgi:hypothetical protein
MPPFIYRCPTTGFNIQGATPDDAPAGSYFISVTCPICSKLHLVNPSSGAGALEDGGSDPSADGES